MCVSSFIEVNNNGPEEAKYEGRSWKKDSDGRQDWKANGKFCLLHLYSVVKFTFGCEFVPFNVNIFQCYSITSICLHFDLSTTGGRLGMVILRLMRRMYSLPMSTI